MSICLYMPSAVTMAMNESPSPKSHKLEGNRVQKKGNDDTVLPAIYNCSDWLNTQCQGYTEEGRSTMAR